MALHDLQIRPFNVRGATEHEYTCLNVFENTLRAEVVPDDPPIACDEETGRWQALPHFFEEGAWAFWELDGRRIAAFASIDADYSGDNLHASEFGIEVLPEYRRQGLGRQLLRRVVAFAGEHNRRLLITSSTERVPAGGEFLKRIGATRASEGGENQLNLADVNRALLKRWMRQGEALSREFCLELWEGPVPERYLSGMVALIQELINDAPRDALELEDTSHIDKTWRPFEAMEIAGGRRRWMMVAIHRADDRLAGMTGVVWSPRHPGVIWQHGTGTLRDFRNRGLGRWLKASMLDKILRELPQARTIRTGNASSNAPMLKINYELGFKPFLSRPIWQVGTETVGKYLAESNPAG